MRLNYETNTFVGAGEDSAFIIIRNMFELEEKQLRDFPSIGIYKQVPLDYLLQSDVFASLRSDFQKGSIDILVINRDHDQIACRVQGKKGDLKMQRESLQKHLLEDACVHVVDIHKYECRELFKNRINQKSIREVQDAFKTARVMITN